MQHLLASDSVRSDPVGPGRSETKLLTPNINATSKVLVNTLRLQSILITIMFNLTFSLGHTSRVISKVSVFLESSSTRGGLVR